MGLLTKLVEAFKETADVSCPIEEEPGLSIKTLALPEDLRHVICLWYTLETEAIANRKPDPRDRTAWARCVSRAGAVRCLIEAELAARLKIERGYSFEFWSEFRFSYHSI